MKLRLQQLHNFRNVPATIKYSRQKNELFIGKLRRTVLFDLLGKKDME